MVAVSARSGYVVPAAAGLERFFAEFGDMFAVEFDPERATAIVERHGLLFPDDWVAELEERYGVTLDR